MKKPKITEGEWVVSDFRPHVGVLKYNGLAIKVVCEFNIETDWMNDPNMKAISAVPEMIDALVEFKRRYSNEVHNQDFHIQVEQALKKAGCTDAN